MEGPRAENPECMGAMGPTRKIEYRGAQSGKLTFKKGPYSAFSQIFTLYLPYFEMGQYVRTSTFDTLLGGPHLLTLLRQSKILALCHLATSVVVTKADYKKIVPVTVGAC